MDARQPTPTPIADGSPLAADAATIGWIEDEAPATADDPGAVILTCANCGEQLIERKCKLVCRCGYFLSCSDYY